VERLEKAVVGLASERSAMAHGGGELQQKPVRQDISGSKYHQELVVRSSLYYYNYHVKYHLESARWVSCQFR
jgi:hypothetical protein